MAASDDCRIWIGNLADKVNQELLYELFLQAGPIEDVLLPRENGRFSSFAYVTFKHQCSVQYAVELFKRTFLFGKEIKVKPKIRDSRPESQSLNSLRGFSGDFGMRGRDDLSKPFGGGCSDSTKLFNARNSNLLPKEKNNSSRNCMLPEGADYSMLLQMTQQLQQLNNLNNPYDALMSSLALGGPIPYPSQQLDPVMNSNSSNQSGNHRDRHDIYPSQQLDPHMKNRGNQRDSHRDRQDLYPSQQLGPVMKNRGNLNDRHDLYPSQQYDPVMKNRDNQRDNNRGRNDRYNKTHPYRDYRQDDRRNSGSRYNQSSSSHYRERR